MIPMYAWPAQALIVKKKKSVLDGLEGHPLQCCSMLNDAIWNCEKGRAPANPVISNGNTLVASQKLYVASKQVKFIKSTQDLTGPVNCIDFWVVTFFVFESLSYATY